MIVSDGERAKVVRSPTPKNGIHSQDHTFIKDDHHSNHYHHTEGNDNYVDDMKKGTSNILVGKHSNLIIAVLIKHLL